MTSSDELKRENEILRDRISKLTAASLRISATLDLDTVLTGVVESARALSGARWGAITTIDGSGSFDHIVTSGFTPDEHCPLMHWQHGLRLFQHFRDLEGALRLKDVPGFFPGRLASPRPRCCQRPARERLCVIGASMSETSFWPGRQAIKSSPARMRRRW